MWRVIKPRAYSAFLNQGLVEAMVNAINNGTSPATIRLYEWKPSSVAVGINERIEERVNLEECKRQGVDVVRRPSGGGTVYLDEQGCFTYGMLSQELTNDIKKNYDIVCSLIIDAFRELGIEASFRDPNDIIVQGKKISGNTQIAKKKVGMVSGTILYELDKEKMFSLIKPDVEKMKAKGYVDPFDCVTCIKDHAQVSKEKVYETFLKVLTEGKEWSYGKISSEEMEHAKDLEETKYRSPEWMNIK